MLKYLNAEVTFREIPDEITLCINITGCPNNCEGCHSPWLAEDTGEHLDWEALNNLIKSNKGITCVAFMGGDADPMRVDIRAEQIKETYPMLKVAWYSGRQELSEDIELKNFDYIKLGPYIKELGGLDNPKTNQRLYHIIDDDMNDITYKFWNDSKNSL